MKEKKGKQWKRSLKKKFQPKFFTINSNCFILQLHQYSTLRNYFIRNSPITSKNDQAGFLSVFHVPNSSLSTQIGLYCICINILLWGIISSGTLLSPQNSKNDQAGFLSVFHVLAFLHSSTASPQLNDRHSFITNHFRTTQNSNYWSKFSKWVHF